MLDGLWNVGNQYEIGIEDAVTLRYGFEIRAPFLDFELVSFVETAPVLFHRWKGTWRSLQKSAFVELYPDIVAQRLDKADFSHESIEMSLCIAPEHSELCALDLVDAARRSEARRRIEIAAASGAPGPVPWDWVIASGVDRWLSSGVAGRVA